jgi:uncharacterized protein (DUF1810 family)
VSSDPFRLQRFVDAQAPVWPDVQAQLLAGSKRTHWMWFVFPQLAALGRSGTAKFYGLAGAAEARAYLEHPVLGARLVESCTVLLQLQELSARHVFGEIDAMKLRSCLTLFEAVAPGQKVFGSCLERYFGGGRDPLTLAALSD